MTATKPARTMTVTCPLDVPYVRVVEGKKVDTYRLDSGYACVKWTHTGDQSRGGIVRVNGAGVAYDCDCRGWRHKGKCRHVAGTTELVRRGVVEPGVVADAADAMRDTPESWLATVE